MPLLVLDPEANLGTDSISHAEDQGYAHGGALI